MTDRTAFAEIDRILRRSARTVWLVTAAHGGNRSGLVATWVAAASIDPEAPLVMAGLAPNHHTTKLALASRAFGLHLVGAQHLEIIWKFCLHSGDVYDKFAGVSYRVGDTGSPLLTDCLAAVDCRVVDLWDVGDRLFFVAEPVGAQQPDIGGAPLSESDLLATASPEQRAALIERMSQDVVIQRPLRKAWRDGIEAGGSHISGSGELP
jgi:flavin reductase (DIM6/NTAB) family NADH-FMN oxidoreductase RutF